MSGHSHARTIKHKKELTDQKRGQIFSKMARMISIAVKEGGTNPDTNSKLRLAIETARYFKMPKENIERAMKKGSGEIAGEKLEEVFYEAYGPGNSAIIIEGITDNKNRSLSEIKQILNRYNGKLVSEGAIKWMFERKGCITVNFKSQDQKYCKSKEDLELIAIEAGAQDFYWYGDDLDIYTSIGDLEKVKTNLEQKGIKIDSASLDWKAKDLVDLKKEEKEANEKLFEALDESDAVQEIYSNLKV